MLNLNNKQIKNIVILGGGTAGWVTALNFLQKTNDVKITVVSSKEIPIIGVGESTTGMMNNLININNGKIKINELDFIKETDSTFKLGIKHQDWYKKGESFVSPLGDEFKNETNYPHSSYDYSRIYHIAKGLKNEHYTPSKLMLTNRLPYLHLKEKNPYINFDKEIKIDFKLNHIAYHLDTYKVGQYLKDVLKENKNILNVEDKIISVNRNDEGFVKSLKTQNGKIVKGDLFIDCSGFF
jgi:tryptophan 7-halogenase